MASLQLYIQKMFADMQTALSAVQLDMGTLGGKVDTQIIKIDDLIAAVGQTASESIVTSISADKSKTLLGTPFSILNTDQQMCGAVQSAGFGNMKVEFEFNNISAAAANAVVSYTKNGGAGVGIGNFSVPVGAGNKFTSSAINISAGDVFVFKGVCSQGIDKLVLTDAKINYALQNIILDSPFVL